MTKTIKLEATTQTFSSNSGLFLFEQMWKQLKLDKRIKFLLPRKKRNRGPKQIEKFKALLYSFAVGNDCLSDITTSNKDILFSELTGKVGATTMGEFLKSFGPRHVEKLQDFLIDLSFELRSKFFKEDNKFVLSMDSTPHEHHAKKMEGMAYNYKNMWCLDSQNAYDQFGFSYLFDLRPGNTHSGKDSELWINKIFEKCPKGLERWFRADSAYGKNVVYDSLQAKGVKFSIVLKENIGSYVRRRNREVLNWKKTDLEFFNSRDCETAMGIYPVKNLRVVFIRRRKSVEEIEKQKFLWDKYSDEDDNYKYYSIITNINSQEMSNDEVINFYRDRATAESYIREQKYGFDFLNFPCKRLRSNNVFGLVGTFAHNLMRILSFSMKQKWKNTYCKKSGERKGVEQLGYFSKIVRRTCINLAGQVVRSARKIKLRINWKTLEVLEEIMKNLESKLVLQF